MNRKRDHGETLASGPDFLDEIKRAAVAFARRASTEISPHDEGLLEVLAQRLPPGMPMYVAHTPKASVEEV
ncbi:MAG: hypothetical protein ACREU3_15320, partial [Steroidobacteraceae bacterium]